ncbi:MAG: UDP-N-acetylglucosamine-1-phosphate transferase, partial [Nitrosopumilaceae archaeon]|nr:UDP-N-acetylglucosamine-1-phosphate transferase [Nitrosopumilaceae archaeon]
MENQIIAAVLVSIVAFFTVFTITPFLIKFLEKRNLVVKDYNRKGGAMVARPGGISIVIGVITSEIALYTFFPSIHILAIVITSSLAFCVGIV